MWKIPLFDRNFNESELHCVQEVLISGWLTMGEITAEFERQFAEFIGVKHAYAVSSGTAALHLAAMALDIGPGDEVICPSLTFVACANSIKYTGANPVFADITSKDNLNISPQDIESKITAATKAIQVVHFAGYPCDMDAIRDIAERYNLNIIEDCAHAPGAKYKGASCGALGDVGCFSFFSNKNMTTAEGGMVTTNDDKIAAKIKLMRSHGMTTLTLDRHKGRATSYDVVSAGYNYRIDEIRSALGIQQLKTVKAANLRRKELVKLYNENLKPSEFLSIPFQETRGTNPAYHVFPIVVGGNIARSSFMAHLKENGVQTSIHYPPIHNFSYYAAHHKASALPNTEHVGAHEVTLPLYPSMTEEDVLYVCGIVNQYVDTMSYMSLML
jgi:dTDP-4-amino-4,6-dideoxygalactose transaminase